VLATIPGPIVLVGHSYGGAVISNAALGNPNVKALVYIAGFALAEGETVFGIVGQFPGSQLPQNILARPYSQGSAGTGIDAYIDPAAFRQVFAADVPAPTAAVMAATQRPGTLASGSEGSGPPAWQSIPTWYLVANQDRAIPPAAERFMAERAHAHTVEIDSSHVAMISHQDVVTDLILDAATATA
jgi:pimeloyl-ACP methyl ester carboxylesterase